MSSGALNNSGIHKIIIILAAIFLWPGHTRAVNENNTHHFEILKQQLIKDGFDSEKIQTLYNRPEVYFEADGVTVLFTYSEAKALDTHTEPVCRQEHQQCKRRRCRQVACW